MRGVIKYSLSGILLLFSIQFYGQNYCYAEGPPDCSGDWYIAQVNVAGEKGSSIAHASMCEAYADNTTKFCNIIGNGTYTVSVNTAALVSNVGVFVDWNNDGFLSDTTEAYYGVSSGGDFVLPIVPPTGLTDGPKRMRVRAVSYIGVPSSCGLQTFGEVEDYTLYYYNSIDSVPETSVPPTGNYCDGSGSPNCAQADGTGTGYPITKVEITGDNGSVISNSTACDVYSDFSNMKVTVSIGTAYTLAVTGGNAFSYTAAWVDWNEDFDFDDSGEAFAESNYNIGADPFLIAITAPANTAPGLKRIRIRTTGLSAPSACGAQALGEVEDYSLVVKSPLTPTPDCATGFIPANNASNVCQNTRLMWSAVTDAVKYKVSVLSASDGTLLIDTTVSIPGLNVQGLQTATSYKWIVVPVNADQVQAVGCDTLQFTISTIADPLVEIQPNQDTISLCSGVSLALLANTTGGQSPFTYTWTGTNEGHFSALDTVSPSYQSSTTGYFKILVQVSSVNNCKAIDTAVVQVIDVPEVYDLNPEKTGVCAGSPVTLFLNATVGSRNFLQSFDELNYTEVLPSILVQDTFSFAGLTDTVWYKAVVTNAQGCTDTSSAIKIDVFANPEIPVAIASKTNICAGDSAIITVTNYSSGIRWNEQAPDLDNALTVYQAGVYIAFVDNEYGCRSQSAAIEIQVLQNPAIPVIKQLEPLSCKGSQVTLYVQAPQGVNIYWNGLSYSPMDSLKVTTSGSFIVEYRNSDNCLSVSSPFVVDFHPIPPKPTLQRSGISCQGSEVTIYVAVNNGNQVLWNDGLTSGDTLKTGSSGFFSARVTNAFGCENYSDTLAVVFTPRPQKPVISQIGLACLGNTVELVSSYASGNYWNTGALSSSIQISQGGTYKLAFVDGLGCISDTAITTIEFDAIPSTPTIEQLGDTLVVSPILANCTYRWFDQNGTLLAESDGYFIPQTSGGYTVQAISAQGCQSDTSTVYYFSGLGIQKRSFSSVCKVYPQPVKDNFTVELPLAKTPFHLKLMDCSGRLVMEEVSMGGKQNLQLQLQAGMYYLVVNNQDFTTIVPFVAE